MSINWIMKKIVRGVNNWENNRLIFFVENNYSIILDVQQVV